MNGWKHEKENIFVLNESNIEHNERKNNSNLVYPFS